MTVQNRSQSPLMRIAITYGVGAFLATSLLVGGIDLKAQAIAGHNANAPVEYAADRIELQDREKRVVLTGNVVIDQAGMKVRSARTLVNYSDSEDLTISRITASGGVVVERGSERARGDVAIYDLDRRIITMAGNVSLNRGADTLSGDRLVIDLRSGNSSVDGQSTGSGSQDRVTGSFAVPSGGDETGE